MQSTRNGCIDRSVNIGNPCTHNTVVLIAITPKFWEVSAPHGVKSNSMSFALLNTFHFYSSRETFKTVRLSECVQEKAKWEYYFIMSYTVGNNCIICMCLFAHL